jgi:hypothetical protein
MAVVFTINTVKFSSLTKETEFSLLTREVKTGVYGPHRCKADIDFFFSDVKITPASDKACWRAIHYMTDGSKTGPDTSSCRDYYISQKQIHCGG